MTLKVSNENIFFIPEATTSGGSRKSRSGRDFLADYTESLQRASEAFSAKELAARVAPCNISDARNAMQAYLHATYTVGQIDGKVQSFASDLFKELKAISPAKLEALSKETAKLMEELSSIPPTLAKRALSSPQKAVRQGGAHPTNEEVFLKTADKTFMAVSRVDLSAVRLSGGRLEKLRTTVIPLYLVLARKYPRMAHMRGVFAAENLWKLLMPAQKNSPWDFLSLEMYAKECPGNPVIQKGVREGIIHVRSL